VRLFAALVPPERVLTDLRALVDGVREDWPGLRWTRPDQWHVTLTFFGDVDGARVDDLTARLGRAAARAEPMPLSFGAGGTFGSRARARVAWLRVEGARDPLRRLARATDAAGRRAGLEVEDRPYRPHLTLARARRPTDLRPLLDALPSSTSSGWTARRLSLVRSRLGAHEDRGSVHETVADWPLGPAPHE